MSVSFAVALSASIETVASMNVPESCLSAQVTWKALMHLPRVH